MTIDFQERAATFRRLHGQDKPIVLVNAWDAASASVLQSAQALRTVSEQVGVALFINARSDAFVARDVRDEAQRRARLFASAGADGFFVRGLASLPEISRLCANSTSRSKRLQPLASNTMAKNQMSGDLFNQFFQDQTERGNS